MKPIALPAAVLALALASGAGSASAAVEQTPWGGETQAVDPAPSDSELVDFVSAFVRMMGVQHGYMMLLQDETDPVRADSLRRQAATDMEAAIRQDGMTVDRYNSIALAVRADPDLQGRLEGIIEQMASAPEDAQ